MVQTADFTQDEFIIGIFCNNFASNSFFNLIFGLGGLEKLHDLTIFLTHFPESHNLVLLQVCNKVA